MNDVSSRQALINALVVVKGKSPDFDDSSRLADIEIDSLDLLEASLMIENELGINLEGENFLGLETIGDLIQVLERARTNST